MTEDPRMNGFNYGRGNNPTEPIYHAAMKTARQLGADANEKTAEAWGLEMALRNVRLAQTGVEKAIALIALRKAMEKFRTLSAVK